ncbi:MAG: DUF5615 family PIN-like protein [Actinobacteria bacterium]|nr:DUF5615 family PIN-like protein [Actinomycetota bacterium]
MRLLLDEDVPTSLLAPLRKVLPGHDVFHLDELRWKGKKDVHVIADAAGRGFDALLTNDSKQLDNVAECRAIRDSGLHHVRYRQHTGPGESGGRTGLALAMAAVLAAIRHVVRDLEQVDSQRLVLISELLDERRHEVIDPRRHPPAYWPSRPSRPGRRR